MKTENKIVLCIMTLHDFIINWTTLFICTAIKQFPSMPDWRELSFSAKTCLGTVCRAFLNMIETGL
jgi:hypothetical protein